MYLYFILSNIWHFKLVLFDKWYSILFNEYNCIPQPGYFYDVTESADNHPLIVPESTSDTLYCSPKQKDNLTFDCYTIQWNNGLSMTLKRRWFTYVFNLVHVHHNIYLYNRIRTQYDVHRPSNLRTCGPVHKLAIEEHHIRTQLDY